MIDTACFNELKAFAPEGSLLLNEPLRNHTTFKVGGKADAFLSVSSIKQLQEVTNYLKHKAIPYYVIGNGSNLLVSDEGFRGVILSLGSDFSKLQVSDNRIVAQAGALLSAVANRSLRESLTGMEFAAGIPGSIGGGIVMNAGAYDGEMKQIVESVTVLTASGEVVTYTCEEMDFSYRHSRLKQDGGIVLSATFLLRKGNSEEIRAKMKDFAARRREKQPLEFPSAGSTFKRPEGYFAGKLIMDAGLAGYSVGDAQVSEKHCGFVINRGNATAKDIYTLIGNVEAIVKDKFSVELTPEVIFLGKME